MNIWQVIRRSWTYYWQIHLAMILAVALTTAVLTGALTVGDSMRGSLRQLTLDRLGPIDQVVLSQGFFERSIVNQWKASSDFEQAFSDALPTIHFPAGTIERTDSGSLEPSPEDSTEDSESALQSWASVQIWGMDESLAAWNWSEDNFPVPGEKEIVINQSAATRMGLAVEDIGQLLTLRLGKPSDVPTESFIATKDDSVTSLPRLTLKAIVPETGFGRLSLTPGTNVPGLVFLDLKTLRRAIPDATIDARDGVDLFNAILVRGSSPNAYSTPEKASRVFTDFRPTTADAGLKVVHVRTPSESSTGDASTDEPVLDYYSISSNRMLIDHGQQRVINAALEGLTSQRILTYLANRIAKTKTPSEGIPFSMVSAVQWDESFNLTDELGDRLPRLNDNEIVLNQWAAQDLNASVGDRIRLKYYEPETVDGDEVERQAEFKLVGIAALTKPAEAYRNQGRKVVPAEFDQLPTKANDPWLTPEVPGVTDADSIERWELPFETGLDLRPQDDDYWSFYRTTPKAFISKSAGQRLWRNRFGSFTSIRVPADQIDRGELEKRLQQAVASNPSDVGFQQIAAKAAGLAGSQGSTPFDVLFLMFSMFVIVASLMLLALFFRLGMQQRSRELGLWLALGFSEQKARSVWLKESLGSTLIGLLLGSVLGIGYAWLIAYLMRTAWVGAVASPFLYLHWTWFSLLLGALFSLMVSMLVIWWSVRQATAVSTRSLLTGGWSDSSAKDWKSKWWHGCTMRRSLLVLSLILSIGGYFAVGDTQAVIFLSGGFCALAAVLLYQLDQYVSRTVAGEFRWSSIASLNLSRQPLRSMIIVSLVGLATFLIVAVSAFRLSPTERGTAGFDYVAKTEVGVLQDLGQRLPATNAAKRDWIYGFRFHDGEHASCNNPFQARQPQVLGVSPEFVARYDDPDIKPFAWVGTTADELKQSANPWNLLAFENATNSQPGSVDPGEVDSSEKRPIPVVIDKNTAWYSLKVYLPGSRFKISFADIGEVEFQLAGLLDNSVLQGALLVGDADYVRLFPADSGKRFFLVDSDAMPGDESSATSSLANLGRDLKEFGWQVDPADQVLANYMAVQNTYLSAFQSLGALGLLLGTIGLVVAQYRSLLERKREVALFQAIGFPGSKINGMITGEAVRLILSGFIAGLAGALVCMLPHVVAGAASIPWMGLSLTLGAILVVGLVASSVIGRLVMRGGLVGSLRTE